MGSLSPDNLQLMYHLPKPQTIYNKQFLENFSKENEDPTDFMRTWSKNEGKIKKDKTSMYSTTFISPPHSFAADMLCRMFGKLDSTKFSPKWLPLIDVVINATIMNLAQILSNNLAKAIMDYRRKRSTSSRIYP